MPATYSDNPIPSWLETELSDVGKHTLRVLEERHGIRDEVLEDLRDLIRSHYVDPSITARRMESLGASKTAALLREHYPTRKNARSGDLGEILATESAELEL